MDRSLRSQAFTLIEMLVSMTILALIVMVLVSVLNSSTDVWQRSSSKIQVFQEARAAYEAMTRKISQATLNTYWDYEADATGNPIRYRRQSELAFVSGLEATLLPSINPARTHAIFFQAPLGYTQNANYTNLRNLLNACGYFLEFGDDSEGRPTFLQSEPRVPERYRWRLKELWQPTENLAVYQSNAPGNWIPSTPSSTLAENIIALIILPKLPEAEDSTGTSLAPEFSYDSTRSANRATHNQLPPLVQVIMVAIDEASARRAENGATPPDYGVQWTNLFLQATNLQRDLDTLEEGLIATGVNYQIFNSTVAIEGAKWSR